MSKLDYRRHGRNELAFIRFKKDMKEQTILSFKENGTGILMSSIFVTGNYSTIPPLRIPSQVANATP